MERVEQFRFQVCKERFLYLLQALELSKKLVKYTRSAPRTGPGTRERWYWPLVKCVTIKVPNKDILQHVTLVDLPGNGDCNKSRDQMWKEVTLLSYLDTIILLTIALNINIELCPFSKLEIAPQFGL